MDFECFKRNQWQNQENWGIYALTLPRFNSHQQIETANLKAETVTIPTRGGNLFLYPLNYSQMTKQAIYILIGE
jgi:hypothetical protein